MRISAVQLDESDADSSASGCATNHSNFVYFRLSLFPYSLEGIRWSNDYNLKTLYRPPDNIQLRL